MKLRTEITIAPSAAVIDHRSRIVMLGSCFTDEVGARLASANFDVAVNPLGTLFNPISIADAISGALEGRRFDAADLFEVDGTWRTWRRHSRFALPDRDATAAMLNDTQRATADAISSADLLIVTFGSAIAHRLVATGEVTANCHKAPANRFEVKPLAVDDITSCWDALIGRLQQRNPGLKVMFTVSPVRHAGYGLEADRLSKSTLIVAVHEIVRSNPGCTYFPSYEALVDDLRDYRFYADDLVHPSPMAVDYIYSLLCDATMVPSTRDAAARWEKLSRRMQHRHADPAARSKFIADTFDMARELAGDNPMYATRFINRYDI